MEAAVTSTKKAIPSTPGNGSTLSVMEIEALPQYVTPEASDGQRTEEEPITPYKEPVSKKKSGRIGSKRKLFLQNGTSSNKVKRISNPPVNKPRKTVSLSVGAQNVGNSRETLWPHYPLTERQQLQYLLEVTAKEAQQESQDSESDEGQGPLFVQLKRKEMAKKESNAIRVSKRNERGETPLHLAAIKGDLEEVKSLINSDANINIKDFAGWTPLHEACNFGHVGIVEELIKCGACVNTPGYHDITPLHDAVINNHVEVVTLLLCYGADSQKMTVQEYKPIDLARSTSIIELLEAKQKEEQTHVYSLQDQTNSFEDEPMPVESLKSSDDSGTCMTVGRHDEGNTGPSTVSQMLEPAKHEDDTGELTSEADISYEKGYSSDKSSSSCEQLTETNSSTSNARNLNKSKYFIRRSESNSSCGHESEIADEDVDPKRLNECLDKAMIEMSSYLDTTEATCENASVETLLKREPVTLNTRLANAKTGAEKLSAEANSYLHALEDAPEKQPNPSQASEVENEFSHAEQTKTSAFNRVRQEDSESAEDNGCLLGDKETEGPKSVVTRLQEQQSNKENLGPEQKSGWVRKRRVSTRSLSSSSKYVSEKLCVTSQELQECIGHIRNPSWRKAIAKCYYSMDNLPLNVPGYKDFLMFNRSYNISGCSQNDSSTQNDSQDIQLCRLRTKHQVEQEKLRLSLEQEIVRLFGNFARTLIGREVPFGACTILKSQMTTQAREIQRSNEGYILKYPGGHSMRLEVETILEKFDKLKSNLLRRQKHEFDAVTALKKLTQGEQLVSTCTILENGQESERKPYLIEFELIPAAFKQYYDSMLCAMEY